MPSMYSFSVPVFQRGLHNLSAYLDKIEAYASEKGVDAGEIITARLIEDMLPLSANTSAPPIQRSSPSPGSPASMRRVSKTMRPRLPTFASA